MSHSGLLSPHATIDIACPNPDCRGSVQLLASPDGFDDTEVPVLCQRCDQRFTYNRHGGGLSGVLCDECGEPVGGAFEYRQHLINAHGSTMPMWHGFRPNVNGRLMNGHYMCGFPTPDGDRSRCHRDVGLEWSPCYLHDPRVRAVKQ